jgi:hypothetical protein
VVSYHKTQRNQFSQKRPDNTLTHHDAPTPLSGESDGPSSERARSTRGSQSLCPRRRSCACELPASWRCSDSAPAGGAPGTRTTLYSVAAYRVTPFQLPQYSRSIASGPVHTSTRSIGSTECSRLDSCELRVNYRRCRRATSPFRFHFDVVREPNAFLGNPRPHPLCTRAASPAQPAAAAADLKAADLTPPLPPGVRRPWSLPDPRPHVSPHSRNALSRKSQRRRHRAAAGTAARCRAQQSAASSAVEKKPRFMTFLLTIISALKGLRMPRM